MRKEKVGRRRPVRSSVILGREANRTNPVLESNPLDRNEILSFSPGSTVNYYLRCLLTY